ncbi:MAG TPA: hypothetical protein VLX28_18295, partial [Thermoanaerobaculia bacterium]|nr:hypothetical protein [Thermoanaerobaculia bacterium]
YVLTMNEDASLAVVDARFGFAGSQLLAMVFLDSPAEDWALTGDGRRLFVSMPASSRVAVVDGVSWQVSARLATPGRPGRIALQPDEELLWVTYGGEKGDGVAVFDRSTLALAARFPIGAGPHEIAFSDDNRFAFVTNRQAGTVSVISMAARRKLAELPTGSRPVSVAFSAKARLAYVSHQGDGTIAAVTGESPRVVARIQAEPGLGALRFAPGGRFAFVVNPERGLLHVLDAASGRVVQTGVVHGAPDQVTFSDTLAYLRLRGDATVLMVPLAQTGVPDAAIPLVDFPGGQRPPAEGTRPSLADSIVQVPGGNAVLVANPADRAVYFYKEGMAAPMGHFENYGHEPRALMMVDRSLGERPGGVYETVGRLPRGGVYDVVFFLDAPRVVECFELAVAAAPGEPALPQQILVRGLTPAAGLRARQSGRVRFEVLDAGSRQPIPGLRDLTCLAFLSPGTWQRQQPAAESAPGIYELELTPPAAGLYYVYLQSPSLGLTLNNPHSLSFIVTDPNEADTRRRSP